MFESPLAKNNATDEEGSFVAFICLGFSPKEAARWANIGESGNKVIARQSVRAALQGFKENIDAALSKSAANVIESPLVVRMMAVKYILAALHSRAGHRWRTYDLAEKARWLGCSVSLSTLRTSVLGKNGWAKEHIELREYWHSSSESWITPTVLPALDPAYEIAR